MFKSILNFFYMNNDGAIKLVNNIVKKHAPIILDRLGMTENNDGILERIHVVDTLKDNAGATFNYSYTVHGLFGSRGMTYDIGSGEITIHAIAAFTKPGKNGEQVEAKWTRCIAGVLRPFLVCYYIHCLAHELRHYWQYSTGQAFKHDRIGTVKFTPYSMRWEERDANEFAHKYIKSLSPFKRK